LSSEDESIATATFKIIAGQNIYNLSLVKQYIFHDSKLNNHASSCLGAVKKAITSTDRRLMLEEASKHQSIILAYKINWLQVWEAARDRGPFWTNITRS
jgi:hypothetical protein